MGGVVVVVRLYHSLERVGLCAADLARSTQSHVDLLCLRRFARARAALSSEAKRARLEELAGLFGRARGAREVYAGVVSRGDESHDNLVVRRVSVCSAIERALSWVPPPTHMV